MLRIRIAAAVVTIATSVFAGCGGGEDTSGEPASSPETQIGRQIEQSEDTGDDLNEQTEQKDQQTGGDDPYGPGG